MLIFKSSGSYFGGKLPFLFLLRNSSRRTGPNLWVSEKLAEQMADFGDKYA